MTVNPQIVINNNMDGQRDDWPPDHEGRHHRRISSKSKLSMSTRIDMAAMLSEEVEEGTSKESMEFTQKNYVDQYSDTIEESRDSEDDEKSDGEAVCVLSRPCLCTAAIIIFSVAAMFVAGIGTAVAVRSKKDSSTINDANTLESMLDRKEDSQSSSYEVSKTLRPSIVPVRTTSAPTSSPTPLIVFDVVVDFDTGARPVSYELGDFDGESDDGNQEISNGEYQNSNSGTESFNPVFVGAYYYPWHGDNFHNREGYLRKELQPESHEPLLGEYDDSRPEVISQHLSWSKHANIGLWVTSWWGPEDVTDHNTLQILDHNEIGDMKIALHYETFGRLGFNTTELTMAESDVVYMCDNYFGHSSYYRIDGRPVVFLYLSRVLDVRDHLAGVIFTMQNAASRCNEDLFIVGDHVFGDSPDPSVIFDASYYLDAITNYDIYGAMGRPASNYAGKETIDEYFRDQEEWKAVAKLNYCQYIPAVSPGYNDAGVRLQMNHPPLSRRLSPGAEEGSLFGYQIEQARELVDISNLMMVNSFNEWHEDTQIEPAVGNPSTEPILYTAGLEYVGYDDLYLDILRMGTLEGYSNMFDYGV